jgi:AcrR family transcriptional regulator
VEAAAAEIRERGTTATTLDDVCRRSGTGKGQLFHYFPEGREELLLAVAEREAQRVFEGQEPYLSRLTSRPDWMGWRDQIVRQYRDEGLYCPLGVLISDVGRYSPAAQEVASQLLLRWQQALSAGIVATQATGQANPELDADQAAAALIAAIQGGVTVLLSTGSARHLEAGLDLCLDHVFSSVTMLS